ncbi:peptidase inhibitor family I36 protein [Streptomyces rubiginosohelvolus]|uniref:peptidase inhibitor family I36 protein n=1 Tax=Streptomyces rubiginosohelvolus TaxID=67362 RepID=UPI0036B76002
MNPIRKAMFTAAALCMLVAGSVATAAPASAVGNCPYGYVCVYDYQQFGGDKIVSGSINRCFRLYEFKFEGYVESYVNYMSVDAHLWTFDTGTGWDKTRTLVSGKFSSAIPPNYAEAVCTGNAKP